MLVLRRRGNILEKTSPVLFLLREIIAKAHLVPVHFRPLKPAVHEQMPYWRVPPFLHVDIRICKILIALWRVNRLFFHCDTFSLQICQNFLFNRALFSPKPSFLSCFFPNLCFCQASFSFTAALLASLSALICGISLSSLYNSRLAATTSHKTAGITLNKHLIIITALSGIRLISPI